MNLDAVQNKRKKSRKCFKYSKIGHIRRFCKSKITEVLNLKEESENDDLLTSEKSQKEKL